MYRIMIVEDDATIAAVMEQELGGWGYEVERVEDLRQVIEVFEARQPHLVLLDLALPYRSGFYWCAEIRRRSSVPVIFLSSAADNMNQITALHQGADDFIAKPFDLPMLVAKVQAMLRRSYDFGAPSPALRHRGATLDPGAAALVLDDGRIELTKNELGILALLLENKGRVVSREAIMRRLWDDESFIDDNTLTVNIGRLRKKLDEAGLEGFIATKKGIGYWIPDSEGI